MTTEILTDPRLSKPMAALYAITKQAEDMNDPNTATGITGGGGKPGSRPPGRLQCDGLTRRLASILERAVKDASAALETANPREPQGAIITTVGGISVTLATPDEPEAHIPLPPSRHRIEVTRGHLVAKAQRMGLTHEPT